MYPVLPVLESLNAPVIVLWTVLALNWKLAILTVPVAVKLKSAFVIAEEIVFPSISTIFCDISLLVVNEVLDNVVVVTPFLNK